MGAACSAFWTAHDPDDVFAYDTLKFVTIRDRRLGILHYIFMIAILVYVIAIVLLYQKEYLARETPISSIRIVLENSPSTPLVSQPYCGSASSVFPQKYPCVYLDSTQVTSGPSGPTLFITTHLTVTKYNRTCDEFTPCKETVVEGPTEYYVGDIESYKVEIDHSPFAPVLEIDIGDNIIGELQTRKDGSWETYDDIVFDSESLQADHVTVAELAGAANLNLEDRGSEYLEGEGIPIQSYRKWGAVIVLMITYDNIATYYSDSTLIHYDYRPILVDAIEDFAIESIVNDAGTPFGARTVIHRRGIRVIGISAGTLGAFKFQALLIQLTTSLALIKLASVIVDQLAIRVLPRKEHYKTAKFELTEDMSDVADREKAEKLKKKQESQQELHPL
jgi:hypothetical protein